MGSIGPNFPVCLLYQLLLMFILHRLAAIVLIAGTLCLPSNIARSQVLSDGSLSTKVLPNGTTFEINNGSRAGQNLFHSFSQFSIPTGSSAVFNNDVTVQNIFSRVTGGQISTIDGAIKTQGQANLFLLNPSGILFGPNAQLNLGGSFLATTAQGIKFADGQIFSPTINAPPLLSISVPTGLQFSGPSGSITIQNQGHNLISGNELPGVAGSSQPSSLTPIGLQVAPSKTLAIVGGNIDLKGGVLRPEQGQIELAAIASGEVQFNNWQFSIPETTQLGNLNLDRQSLVYARGINLQAANIRLTEGSLALLQNNTPTEGAGIIVKASESLSIKGATDSALGDTGLISNTLQGANAGSIQVLTKRLTISDSATIISRTFSFRGAKGGDVAIVATESTELSGISRVNDDVSLIGTSSFGFGAAGNVSIATGDLRLHDGSSVLSTGFFKGPSGNLFVNAKTVDIQGFQPESFRPSNIAASTFSDQGAAGNIEINAQRVKLSRSGLIDSSSYNNGNAGSIKINASESITIDGANAPFFLPTKIASAAGPLNPPNLRAKFRQPDNPMGSAGDLAIVTPQLSILNGGLVTVQNTGKGNAGTLEIQASTIRLDNQGKIIAETQAGNGGELILQANTIRLLNGSQIAASAGGDGNGGNIRLTSNFLLGVNNSDILARADRGQGGNITISAKSVYGLKSQPQLTPQSDITASSNLGFNGTVSITGLDLDLNAGLVQLPDNPTDPSQQVTQGCATYQNSKFIATGRSGLPLNPRDRIQSSQLWTDIRAKVAATAQAIGPTRPIQLACPMHDSTKGT
jgi:filamentous hemagglutinin family protein